MFRQTSSKGIRKNILIIISYILQFHFQNSLVFAENVILGTKIEILGIYHQHIHAYMISLQSDIKIKSLILWIRRESKICGVRFLLDIGQTLIQLNQIIPLRTLHHNLIELGQFFAAIAFQRLSYFAKYPVL